MELVQLSVTYRPKRPDTTWYLFGFRSQLAVLRRKIVEHVRMSLTLLHAFRENGGKTTRIRTK